MSKLIKIYIKIVLVFIGVAIQNNAFAMQNGYRQLCVPSIKNLVCHYSITESEKKELDLSLEDTEYIKMAYMCTAVKLLNGYIATEYGKTEHKNKIKSFADITNPEKSNTPEETNVLVPYLSYITKDSKYHKVGFLQRKDEKKLVLISGKVETEAITDIYNSFLSDGIFKGCGPISIQNSPHNGTFNSAHTEYKLLEILKDEINELKPEENGIKGVVIDMFSWLDTCSRCAKNMSDYLYNNIPVLFRVVSQRKYGELVPMDLSKIVDNDYMHDFTFLSSNHISLATRMDPYSDRIRDMVLEQLNLNVHRRALSEDITFWTSAHLGNLSYCSEALYENVIDILSLRGSVNGTLLKCHKLLIIQNDYSPVAWNYKICKDKLNECYLTLKSIIIEDKSCDVFLGVFHLKSGYEKFGATKDWGKVFLGNIVLRLAQTASNEQQTQNYLAEYKSIDPTQYSDWNYNAPTFLGSRNYSKYKELKEKLKLSSDIEDE